MILHSRNGMLYLYNHFIFRLLLESFDYIITNQQESFDFLNCIIPCFNHWTILVLILTSNSNDKNKSLHEGIYINATKYSTIHLQIFSIVL